MQRNKQTEAQKKLRRQLKREDFLWSCKHSLPWVELDKPYQSGWSISIGIREDYQRTKNADVYVELIPIVFGKAHITRNVNLIKAIRKMPKRELHESINRYRWSYDVPRVESLSEKQFEKLPEHLKKYFNLTKWCWFSKVNSYSLNLPKHIFKYVIKPNIITHVQEIDCDLESELALITSYHNKNIKKNFEARIIRGDGRYGYNGYSIPYNRHKKEFKKQFKREIENAREELDFNYYSYMDEYENYDDEWNEFFNYVGYVYSLKKFNYNKKQKTRNLKRKNSKAKYMSVNFPYLF